MTITRVGTNQKYSDGWDAAFGGKRSKSKPAAKKGGAKAAAAKKSRKRRK